MLGVKNTSLLGSLKSFKTLADERGSMQKRHSAHGWHPQLINMDHMKTYFFSSIAFCEDALDNKLRIRSLFGRLLIMFTLILLGVHVLECLELICMQFKL
jgi:hypothetical protein